MLWKLLKKYMAPYRVEIFAILALQLISVTMALELPTLNGEIIDKGVSVGDTGFILSTGALMLVITAIQIVSSFAGVYFGAKAAMSFGRDLRAAVFHHVGELSGQEVGKIGAPSLITRTTNDVQQVQMLVMLSATMMVTAPIICIGGIVKGVREDLQLSKLLLVCIPLLAGTLGFIIARMVPKFRKQQVALDGINRILREQIMGMRVVRAFVREPVEAQRFESSNDALTTLALQIGRLGAVMWPSVLAIFNTSSVAVLWFGASRVATGSLAVGSLMAYLSYLMQILMSVMMATFLTMLIPRAAVCADRIMEVLNMKPSVSSPVHSKAPTALTSILDVKNLVYKYPGAEAPVLSDISFTATPGTTTAIIGSTGAGKTTLLEIIARLGDPTEGSVVVDGLDTRERELEEYWARVGMVPQRAYLFSGTVASNLRFGNPDATDEQLWAALEVAQGKDFVEAMPEKLESTIAQGGTNVSGGQRQRLAIARALLREPGVFLFDDSFSALDLATEARLRKALKPRTANATVIVVAQRVASIVDADQILVIDGGKIVGRGTHAELLQSNPTYIEIVTSQEETKEAA
ncbi:MAG TPA: ABC transporter ATP-binding protein [Kofleriaceae bacterium]|jgi:ATP-binding cassette subfamily B protein